MIFSPNSSTEGSHPHELYIRGGLWLGTNILMVVEELAEALDGFRSKFLAEVEFTTGLIRAEVCIL